MTSRQAGGGAWLLASVLIMGASLIACSGSGAVKGSGPETVAVWDLQDLSPVAHDRDGMGELLANQIAARLDRDPAYQMVERKELLRVLEELKLGSSDLADADTRLKLGRILGARQMIFGAFQVVGPTMRLDLRRVDVATGKILKTAKGTADSDGLGGWLDAADQAAVEIIKP